jgi:hypothetical protein
MPGVDTIEALTSAAQAFDATPLGLQVDPDADAAVRESLQRTGIVLLGEAHGMAETPVLVEELIAWFGLDGIALEWHEDLRPWLDGWIADGVLTDPVRGSDLAGEVWGGDGRLTAGHLAALRRWAASGVLITLMDGSTNYAPAPGGDRGGDGAAVVERAGRGDGRPVLAAPDAPGGRLVVAGELHTRLEPLPLDDPIGAQIGVPMGVELARRRPGVCSIGCVYGPGQFYNLGPRCSEVDDLRGQQLDGPQLIMQQGELLLLMPSPREATVPHRELPGLPPPE